MTASQPQGEVAFDSSGNIGLDSWRVSQCVAVIKRIDNPGVKEGRYKKTIKKNQTKKKIKRVHLSNVRNTTLGSGFFYL